MATMNLNVPAGANRTVDPFGTSVPSLGIILSTIRDAFVVRVDAAPAQLDLAREQTKMDGQTKASFWI